MQSINSLHSNPLNNPKCLRSYYKKVKIVGDECHLLFGKSRCRNLPTIRKGQSPKATASNENVENSNNNGDGQKVPFLQHSNDWRIFRAKLVAQQQGAEKNSEFMFWETQCPPLAEEPIWAHSLASEEQGGLLLAGPGMNLAVDGRYWQATVFLVDSTQSGSWGLILNRPSGYTVEKAFSLSGTTADELLSPFHENVLYLGGYRLDKNPLSLIHGHNLEGSEEIIPGVYFGGLEAAAREVREGRLPASDFRLFIGRVEWLPGRLKAEVETKVWYAAASSRNLVLKQCLQLPTPLWREVLELMGGEYAAIARGEEE